MSDSLQDQLIKAGLVSQERAKQLEQKNKPRRRPSNKSATRKASGKHGAKFSAKNASTKKGSSDLARAYAIRAQTERKEREEEAARRKAEAQRRREVKIGLKKIIAEHGQNDDKAEIPRNFEYRGKIKRIYVTQQQQTALSEEKLGIAMVAGRCYLLPLEAISEVAKLQEEAVAWPRAEADNQAEAGEYAEFQVPDDLMW